MEKIQIRKAQFGDEKYIHEAHMRSIREICVKDHGQEEIRGWGYRPLDERWTEPIKTGNVWVVEKDQQIFGFGFIRFFESDGVFRAHLHALYLTPEVTGQGIGKSLADIMIKRAKDLKVKSITLESSITAHKFYLNLGFRDMEPKKQLNIGGFPVTCFPMAIEISD